MSQSYMPAVDAQFDLWQLNFNSKVQINPATYGLDNSYASALAPLSADFHTKLGISANPATRTKVNTAAKNAARAALKSFIRVGVGITQATPAVTVQAREDLGIPLHDSIPSPIPAPTTFPVIDATPSGPHLSKINVSDSETPDSAKKPDGVMAMALFAKAVAPGGAPITDPEQLDFVGLASRTHIQQQWDATDANKTAYIAGAWITRTGKRGPWSAIITTGIAA